MGAILHVDTGELRVSAGGDLLVANAIGSCVVCSLYDPLSRVGGMVHVMLPGRSNLSCGLSRFRYAEDGIEEMLCRVLYLGAKRSVMCGFCAGGANVLRHGDDTVCLQNILSCKEQFARLGLPITASSLGGFERRRVIFDLGRGMLFCAVGDGPLLLLWSHETTSLNTHANDQREKAHASA